MNDRNELIKFGPEWLRNNLSNDRNSSNCPGSSSNNASVAGSSSGASSNTQVPKVKLANLRYGREEILALYDKNHEPPNDLKGFSSLYVSRPQSPIALSAAFGEETRETVRNIQPSSTMLGGDRYGVGRVSSNGERGRGRGNLAYLRQNQSGRAVLKNISGGIGLHNTDRGPDENLFGEPPSNLNRSWITSNNLSAPAGRNGVESDWNPNTSVNRIFKRWPSNSNWRKPQAGRSEEGDGEWRTADMNRPRNVSQQEKWDREWADRANKEKQSWNTNRRPWTSDQNSEENLPEWAIESTETCGGSFDSAGEFHGYSCDDSNLPKASVEAPFALTRSQTQGSIRLKSVEEGTDEWWLSDKAKKLSNKKFDATEIKFKRDISDIKHSENTPVSHDSLVTNQDTAKIQSDDVSSQTMKEVSNRKSPVFTIGTKINLGLDGLSLPENNNMGQECKPNISGHTTQVSSKNNVSLGLSVTGANNTTITADEKITGPDVSSLKMLSSAAPSSKRPGILKPGMLIPESSHQSLPMPHNSGFSYTSVPSATGPSNLFHTSALSSVPVPGSSKSIFTGPVKNNNLIQQSVNVQPQATQSQVQSTSYEITPRQGLPQDPFGNSIYDFIPQNQPVQQTRQTPSTTNALDLWYYEDPGKNVQGPFNSVEMYIWYKVGFFSPKLMVRRACETHMRPLGSYGPVPPFVMGVSICSRSPTPQGLSLNAAQNTQPARNVNAMYNCSAPPQGLSLNAAQNTQPARNVNAMYNCSPSPQELSLNAAQNTQTARNVNAETLWNQATTSSDTMWMQQPPERDMSSNTPYFWSQQPGLIYPTMVVPNNNANTVHNSEENRFAELRVPHVPYAPPMLPFLGPEQQSVLPLGTLNLGQLDTNSCSSEIMNATSKLEELERLIQREVLDLAKSPLIEKPQNEETFRTSTNSEQCLSPEQPTTAPNTNVPQNVQSNALPEPKQTIIKIETNEKPVRNKENNVNKGKVKNVKAKDIKKGVLVENRTDSEHKPVVEKKRDDLVTARHKKDEKPGKKEIEQEKMEWIKDGFTIVKGHEKGTQKDKPKTDAFKTFLDLKRTSVDEKEEDKKKRQKEQFNRSQDAGHSEIKAHPQPQQLFNQNVDIDFPFNKKVAWSSTNLSQQSTNNNALTFTEIQRLEKEKKLSQVKEQNLYNILQQKQQQSPFVREQELQSGLGWANVDQIVGDLEVQSRKQSVPASEILLPGQQAGIPQSISWNSSYNGGGFWDTERDVSNQKSIEKSQDTNSEAVLAKKKSNVPCSNPTTSPESEFETWCISSMSMLCKHLNEAAFCDFLKSLKSPLEVKKNIKLYIGETKECNDFAQKFIERRFKLQCGDRNTHVSEMPVAAAVISSRPSAVSQVTEQPQITQQHIQPEQFVHSTTNIDFQSNKKAPWTSTNPNFHPLNEVGLTLADIQKMEREKKLLLIKEQNDAQITTLLQQAAVDREQELQSSTGWIIKSAINTPNFDEIKAAETEFGKQHLHTTEDVSSGNRTIISKPMFRTANYNGAPMYQGGFWDTEIDLSIMEPIEKPQEQNKEASKNKKKPNMYCQKPSTSPENEFKSWCINTMSTLNNSIDGPTFFGFLRNIESPYEVKDYVKMYFGESKECGDFARQFLEKRSKLLHGSTNTPVDDLSAPAAAITPRPPCDLQDVKGKGKKSKKNKMTKVDARILGFSVTAAEDRINVGDIDTV